MNNFVNEFLQHINVEHDSLLEIVLKGHLVIEIALDSILKLFFPSPKFYDDAKLSFHQKLQLVRARHWREQNNEVWHLITKINGLRNALAHNLEEEKIKKSLNSVLKYQLEIEPQESREVIVNETEKHQVLLAFGLIAGFLSGYEKDAKFLSELNKGIHLSFERTRKKLP